MDTNIFIEIGQMSSVHPWSGRPGFSLRSSHSKDSKIVLDTALLSTQLYKVRIKGNGVEPSLPLGVVVIENGAFRSPTTKVANFTFFYIAFSY